MIQATSYANVYSACDMQQADFCRMSQGVVGVFSDRCPGKLTPNEDAAAVIPLDVHSGILAVADGVGGGRGGERASAAVIEALRKSLDHTSEAVDPLRVAILNGIETANQRVLDLGLGAATTLALVEIHEKQIRTYHVGDSRILVVGQRGKVKLKTISHSPVGFAVEAGVMDATEAMHHEERHLVSNVVGTSDMRIEIGSKLQLAPRDTLLVASDGLFDNLHLSEIVERVRKGPIESALEKLVSDTKKRMHAGGNGHPSKPDDLTIVVYRPTTHKPARQKQRRLS